MKSVFFRYALSITIIFLLSFAALISIIYVAIGNHYVTIRQNELERISYSATEILTIDYRLYLEQHDSADGLVDIDNLELRERFSALTNDTDFFIFVTDSEGNVLSFGDGFPDLLETQVYESINREIVENGSSDGISDCGLFEDRFYYYGMEARDFRGRYIATIYTCLPESQAKAPVSALMKPIFYVSLGVLLAAILAAYFISEKITHPLASMSKAAQAFSEGDFSVRVPVRGGAEIAEFARIFNSMAENLENMEKTRNDFVANVSHDLRSPMTSITGFVDGMLSGVIPPEKHEHYLRIVLSETKRLSRLVATLLDISRIQAGERKFRMVNFDICEMARQIIISFENRIEEKNLDVSFSASEDRIYVNADMDAIYQVLYNLCDNATKFAADEKKFSLSITEKNGLVSICVYNEGEGISEEDLKHIFDRFYKGDKSRGKDKSGTGLGLFISQKIIEAHKQKIVAQSEQGEYCAFSFSLEKGDAPLRARYSERNGLTPHS